MAYTFKYELNQAPRARLDGSGLVTHAIWAVVSNDGGGTWLPVPGYRKALLVPADDLATVMAMPDGTGQERQAKVAAYKGALVDNVDTEAPAPTINWSVGGMTDYMEANDAAVAAAADADELITQTMGLSYPVKFSL